MNDRMTIARSLEEGMYILREGDCFWRVDEDGKVDCAAQGLNRVFEQLVFIQQLKSPSRRIFQKYPLNDSSD